jgi:methyl-accepting chemotaxis protein
MSTDKNQTLEQVDDAIDAVEEARAIHGLTDSELSALETASEKLSNIERSITKMVSNELVGSLSADANSLNDLANQIKESADKLEDVASVIEKAAHIVEGFINAVGTATSAGI